MVRPMPQRIDEARRQRRADQVADRADREGDAESERRQAVEILQHEGRAGNPGEQAANRQQVAMPRCERRSRGRRETADRMRSIEPATPARARAGCSVSGSSSQTIARRSAARRRVSATKFERQPNAGLQHAADHRRDDRRQRHDRAHQRQFAAGARAGVKIAHDRARQHDRAGAADRLQRSARAISISIDVRQRTDKRRGADRSAERGQQHRLAAMPVGERAVDDLADGKADQIGRDRELHLRRRRAEQRGRCPAATADTCRSTAARCRSAPRAAAVSAKVSGRSIGGFSTRQALSGMTGAYQAAGADA